ncbi:MAG: helix-turn-helix transcriptional regulator [Phyllobacteriaceae bacterium]|nr:helix-turn-helix transcriptional regulator [Phyllobacteriaceae bacterium]
MRNRSNIRTGAQIRAARALVGLTQAARAEEVGTTARTIRAWESRHRPPSDAPIFAGKVEEAFRRRGVMFVSDPAIGVQLSETGSFRAP